MYKSYTFPKWALDRKKPAVIGNRRINVQYIISMIVDAQGT
jgi:hypothetical protein